MRIMGEKVITRRKTEDMVRERIFRAFGKRIPVIGSRYIGDKAGNETLVEGPIEAIRQNGEYDGLARGFGRTYRFEHADGADRIELVIWGSDQLALCHMGTNDSGIAPESLEDVRKNLARWLVAAQKFRRELIEAAGRSPEIAAFMEAHGLKNSA